MQAIFGYLVMRTMRDGGKLSCGALNTCSKLTISPLSEGWFNYMPLFSWYSCKPKNAQLENTDAKNKFKSFLWSWHWKAKISRNHKLILLIFSLKVLSYFFVLFTAETVSFCGGFKVPVIWAFNGQRILSWNENLFLDFLSFNVRVRVLYLCWIEIQ